MWTRPALSWPAWVSPCSMSRATARGASGAPASSTRPGTFGRSLQTSTSCPWPRSWTIFSRWPATTARQSSLLAMERECQAGHDEGHEKDRQDALSTAPEVDDFAFGRVERLGTAGVSAAADL